MEWAVSELVTNGKVTRNTALKNFITRLGAIICSLNNNGWEILGKNEREQNGYGRKMDYVYRLIRKP